MLDNPFNALYDKTTMKDKATITEPPILEKFCKCGCGKLFIPNRKWQEFFNPQHQKEYWKKIITNQYQLSKKVKELEDKLNQLNNPK